VLAFRHFPQPHWRKIWSTNLLERVNEEIKRRTRVVGIFPNDAAITRLVGAVLLEQDEHWQLEGRRMFSAESMAAIPSLEELPALPGLQEAAATERRPQVIAPQRPHRAQRRRSSPGGRRTRRHGAKIAGVAHNRSAIQTKDLTSQSSGFIVKQRGASAPRNDSPSFPLFTLRSGQSGLGIYTTRRDAAWRKVARA
jgi:hypothetical protein